MIRENPVQGGKKMTTIKSFSVSNGDLFYVRHNSDNFTIIDCNLNGDRDDEIIAELKSASKGKGIKRFISTHPDQDHFSGIEKLDAELPIANFYVVKNKAVKTDETVSFRHYCDLRDDTKKAFYISKNCKRKWMNQGDGVRTASGINILWPDVSNAYFKQALADCNEGKAYNNVSAAIRYSLQGGASVMWLGDLETEFMEAITDSINLSKTTIVFAAHHGRASGKIPDSWLEKLDPQIIVIGEAASRHLHYYTGYKTITQNSAGDITIDAVGDRIHFYVSSNSYSHDGLQDEGQSKFPNYIGSIKVETEYTL
jgi:beta-lactamase superfamily II metal-dependent hydrolase